MGNLKDYGTFNLDAFEDDNEEVEKAGKSSEYMKLLEGDNVVRFLPPPLTAEWAKRADGRADAFKLIHEHFAEVPGLQHKVRFVCPRMHGGEFCPECSDADDLIRTGNSFDKDAARDKTPAARTYCNVIDRADDAKGPKVLAFPKTVREGLTRIGKRYNFLDPSEKGFDVVITKSVKNKKTEYDVQAERDSSPLGDFAWLEKQFNLDSYARVPTLDEIRDMLSGEKKDRGGRGDRLERGGDRQKLSDGRKGREDTRTKKRTAADDVLEGDFEEVEEAMDLAGAGEELPD